MKLLSDVLDRKNYARLVRVFGGKRIWVPKTGNPGHREGRVYIVRAERMAKLKAKGWGVGRIAARFNISEKRVYTILRKHGQRHGDERVGEKYKDAVGDVSSSPADK